MNPPRPLGDPATSRKRGRGLRPGAPLATLCALAACGPGDEASGWAGSVDTLPGGAVVVRSPATGLWGEGERWRLVEDLRLGTVDGEGPEQFSRPTALEVDAEGRLWVVDGQAREVRVFSATGAFVRSVGRPGAGPGELSGPWDLFFSPDGRVWVQDNQNRRYEVFDSAGAYVRSERMKGLAFSGGDVFASDGRFYQITYRPREDGALDRVLVPHVLEADTLAPLDTLPLPSLESSRTVPVTWSAGGRTMRMERPIPFTPQPLVHLDRLGNLWLSEGEDRYRILRLTPAADTVRILERAYETVPVSDSAVDAAIETLGPPGAAVELDRDRIPAAHPPFDHFMAAPDGTLWVRRHRAPGEVAFDVFDPEGRYLGEAAGELDLAGFRLLHVTADALYGVHTDELGVPFIVRLLVQR